MIDSNNTNGGKPTRTEKTTRRYLDLARAIYRRIPVEMLSDPEAGIKPEEVVEWFKQQAPGLRKATFRQYKAAIICHFEHIIEKYPDEHTYRAALDSLASLSSSLSPPSKTLPKRTSSGKVKRIRMDDLRRLGQEMMSQTKSKWYGAAFTMLAASVASGLRPSEWPGARIVETGSDGSIIIEVANAKNTNGRANGDSRRVAIPAGWMSDYVQWQISATGKWLSSGKNWNGYCKECARALASMVRKLWPNQPDRHYTLYSGRHQFAANAKRAGLSRREVANLMGHASEETASEHYGKRRSGYGGLVVKVPMPEPTQDITIGEAEKTTESQTPAHPPLC